MNFKNDSWWPWVVAALAGAAAGLALATVLVVVFL